MSHRARRRSGRVGFGIQIDEARIRRRGSRSTGSAGRARADHREGFADGGFAELGAIRIYDTHEYTQKYVAEFGLELIPLTDTGRPAFYMQGRRFLAPEPGEIWPLDGFDPSELPDPYALIPNYLLSGFEKVGDVLGPNWPEDSDAALSLASITVEEYMASQGASGTWRRWFYAQEGYVARMSALAAFTERDSRGRLALGLAAHLERLPAATAGAIPAPPRRLV